MDRQISALLCRTSDRSADAAAGTRELGELLGARLIGEPGAPRTARYADDLRDAHGCLLEAGGQIDDALAAGTMPILLAGECSVAVATLPVVRRHRPDVWLLWLDAHADFNTPATSASGYLAGMCLAGACGLWDTGFGTGPEPARTVTYGVRDLDAAELVALDLRGVGRIERAGQLAGAQVFLHLDLDVLDPAAHPAGFPVAGGSSPDALRAFLAELAGVATVVGAEVTAAAPGYGAVAAELLAPLLQA